MTAAAMLMKEVETLPEEAMAEALAKSNEDDGLKIWEGLTSGMKNPSHAKDFRKISREELYDRF